MSARTVAQTYYRKATEQKKKKLKLKGLIRQHGRCLFCGDVHTDGMDCIEISDGQTE